MILCCGEALIDMLPAKTASGNNAYCPHAGGAVFNTAIALGRLAVPTGMLSGISTDLHGQMLEKGLVDSGVDISLTIRSARPTTLAFVHLKDGQASYTFYDEGSAGRMLEIEAFPPLPDAVSALYCGGISLAVEPAADGYAHFVRRHAVDCAVMLDPNIRPGFIADQRRYRERLDGLVAVSDILKMSDEDLAWLVPGEETVASRVASLQGPSVILVTEGGRGATAYLRGGRSVEVAALKAVVFDTVGAGDTFNAGVMAHLFKAGKLDKKSLRAIDEAALRDAITFGHRVAAVTVSRAGANPPWAAELAD